MSFHSWRSRAVHKLFHCSLLILSAFGADIPAILPAVRDAKSSAASLCPPLAAEALADRPLVGEGDLLAVNVWVKVKSGCATLPPGVDRDLGDRDGDRGLSEAAPDPEGGFADNIRSMYGCLSRDSGSSLIPKSLHICFNWATVRDSRSRLYPSSDLPGGDSRLRDILYYNQIKNNSTYITNIYIVAVAVIFT